jgi:hypothetical protein
VLADLLAAYGLVKPDDAAAPILEHVDAAIPRVRAAARAAFLAYVSGPPPRPERHTLRLIGGHTSDGPLRLTYRDFARLAIRERLANEYPELLEPECRAITEDGQRDRVCEAMPMRLAEAYFARLATTGARASSSRSTTRWRSRTGRRRWRSSTRSWRTTRSWRCGTRWCRRTRRRPTTRRRRATRRARRGCCASRRRCWPRSTRRGRIACGCARCCSRRRSRGCRRRGARISRAGGCRAGGAAVQGRRKRASW